MNQAPVTGTAGRGGRPLHLRSAEWLLVIYFGYVAAVAPRFPLQQQLVWRPFLVELLVCALFLALAYGESHEHAEFSASSGIGFPWLCSCWRIARWIGFRRWRAISIWSCVGWNGTGPSCLKGICSARSNGWARWGRCILELCYLLVYAVAPVLVAVLYLQHRRERVNGALFLYLLGTLAAYALFPYFPSDPPRIAFGGSDMPNIVTALRQLNLWLLTATAFTPACFPARTYRRYFRPPGRCSLFCPSVSDMAGECWCMPLA